MNALILILEGFGVVRNIEMDRKALGLEDSDGFRDVRDLRSTAQRLQREGLPDGLLFAGVPPHAE